MLSSISSSSKGRSRAVGGKAVIAIFIAVIIAVLAAAEALARFWVERTSNVQVIVNREHEEAIHIWPGTSPGRKNLLIIGNSFVGMDLNLDMLRQGLDPGWQVHRYWLYNTSYDDWYFGLRRLFADGSRPDVVAITFAALNWYRTGIRGDYSSPYLFRAQDIPEIGAEAHLDRTEQFNLLVARYSKFYSLRSEIRKVLLQRSLLPRLPEMYSLFQPATGGHHYTSSDLLGAITPRIAKLRQVASEHDAKLILIVPPLPRPDDEYHRELLIAAQRAGVQAIIPLSSADVAPRYFIDDTHLTESGARVFTGKVLPRLREALGESSSSLSAGLSLKHSSE